MAVKHEVLAEGVEIWCGDSTKIMKDFSFVDHIICDPPYEKEAHIGNRRTKDKGRAVQNALEFDAISSDIRNDICSLVSKICNGWFIAFCQAEGIAPWRDSIEEFGMKYKKPMIWVKPDGLPQLNGQGPGMGWESMVTAWCGSGCSKWNGGGRHGVFTYPKYDPYKIEHQTVKPLPLMSELIKLFTQSADTVLDPFMGSGTTGVACVKLGRKFIGIELDEKYYEIAKRRISDALDRPDLFIESPAKTIQEKMDI